MIYKAKQATWLGKFNYIMFFWVKVCLVAIFKYCYSVFNFIKISTKNIIIVLSTKKCWLLNSAKSPQSHQEHLPLDWVYLEHAVVFLVTSHADACDTFTKLLLYFFVSLTVYTAWGTFCSNQSLVNCHLPINCCFISLSLDSTPVLCISTFSARLLQLDAIILCWIG